MKFALLTVTYSGLFYKGQALTLEEQILRAKQLGFEGLAIETKRPIASPLDLDKADRDRIRRLAADEGITLCAIESTSNFASRYMEDRENNLAMMRLVLEFAKDLGIDLVKVFAAWPGLINDEEEVAQYGPYEKGNYYKPLTPADLRRWNRCVEGIREVADLAGDLGISLALQNHGPVISPGYEDVLAMMQEIERKNVKLCLDVPLFQERQEDAYVREAVQKCRKQIVFTHYGAWNFRENSDGEIIQDPSPSTGELINYQAFVDELVRVGYNGFLSSEYCLPIVQNHKIAGIDAIDHATRISLKYMKQLVHNSVLA